MARAGINTNWLLTGDGEMLQGAQPGRDQVSAVYNMQEGVAQGQAQYLEEPEAPVYSLDGALLRQCWGACAAVHGAPFSAANTFLQLEHAVDLYNLLLRLAAASAKSRLEDFARLETNGLADQLRLFVKMGWARPWQPPSDSGSSGQ